MPHMPVLAVYQYTVPDPVITSFSLPDLVSCTAQAHATNPLCWSLSCTLHALSGLTSPECPVSPVERLYPALSFWRRHYFEEID